VKACNVATVTAGALLFIEWAQLLALPDRPHLPLQARLRLAIGFPPTFRSIWLVACLRGG